MHSCRFASQAITNVDEKSLLWETHLGHAFLLAGEKDSRINQNGSAISLRHWKRPWRMALSKQPDATQSSLAVSALVNGESRTGTWVSRAEMARRMVCCYNRGGSFSRNNYRMEDTVDSRYKSTVGPILVE